MRKADVILAVAFGVFGACSSAGAPGSSASNGADGASSTPDAAPADAGQWQPSSQPFAPVVTAGEAGSRNRRLERGGWSVDIYGATPTLSADKPYVRQGNDVCRAPDWAYLDGQGVPRENEVLPVAGNPNIVVQQEQQGDHLRVTWHQETANHGDYVQPARDGTYTLDGSRRVTEASSGTHHLQYSYVLPPEPTDAVSCYQLRLPR